MATTAASTATRRSTGARTASRAAAGAVCVGALLVAGLALPASAPTLAVASAPDWSIVVMPDVQIYSQIPHLRPIHTAVADWIVTEAVTRNVRMVLYPGDLVEHGGAVAAEWDAVEAGVDILDAAGLPYMLAIGNHDYDSDWQWRETTDTGRDSAMFNARFGPARHAGHAWWIGGEFEPGRTDNSYIVQNIGGRRVLFMTLEFGPRQAVVDWANRVLDYHAEKPAFVVTHSYTYFDDTLVSSPDLYGPHEYQGHPDTNDGEELWAKLFRHHGNVVAVFSGHQIEGQPYSVGRVTTTGDRGNPVHGMLFNLQDRLDGGSGYIRLVTVSEAAGAIDVETYSPVLDANLTGDRHAFALSYAPILAPATTTATVALPTVTTGPTSTSTTTPTVTPSATPTSTATSTPTATPTPDARAMLATVAALAIDYLTRVPEATATPTEADMAWFTAPSGVTCVAAYDAVGAASLADSYINEANPGTNNAAPGSAPTWAAGTGWSFTGGQHLLTGVVPADGWAVVARFSNATAAASPTFRRLGGAQGAAGQTRFTLSPTYTTGDGKLYGQGNFVFVAGNSAAGVMAMSGQQGYLNGVANGGAIGAWSGANTAQFAIGALNHATLGVIQPFEGNVQALALYSGTLTAADVAAITNAMNALPSPFMAGAVQLPGLGLRSY